MVPLKPDIDIDKSNARKPARDAKGGCARPKFRVLTRASPPLAQPIVSDEFHPTANQQPEPASNNLPPAPHYFRKALEET
ncbi:unnamed protein product [Cuscuta campestris]|uniref:Uncharacterized protein n=1 Tax=Cuscuta campestris TaxID=132261 RepID=A0A484LSY1_9ASTE|nr:unnamed protein product [Cuscuta campestris]